MRRFFSYLFIVFAIFMIASLSGCMSHKTTATSEVATSYLSKTDTFIRHDSIFVRDSINREVFLKGDTINIILEKFRIEYRDRIKIQNHTDTVYHTDTLTYVSEVVKTSPAPPAKTLIYSILTSLVIGVLVGVYIKSVLY